MSDRYSGGAPGSRRLGLARRFIRLLCSFPGRRPAGHLVGAGAAVQKRGGIGSIAAEVAERVRSGTSGVAGHSAARWRRTNPLHLSVRRGGAMLRQRVDRSDRRLEAAVSALRRQRKIRPRVGASHPGAAGLSVVPRLRPRRRDPRPQFAVQGADALRSLGVRTAVLRTVDRTVPKQRPIGACCLARFSRAGGDGAARARRRSIRRVPSESHRKPWAPVLG